MSSLLCQIKDSAPSCASVPRILALHLATRTPALHSTFDSTAVNTRRPSRVFLCLTACGSLDVLSWRGGRQRPPWGCSRCTDVLWGNTWCARFVRRHPFHAGHGASLPTVPLVWGAGVLLNPGDTAGISQDTGPAASSRHLRSPVSLASTSGCVVL